MKTVFTSIVIAFGMYSRVHIGQVEWTKENMRYTLLAFPLVGLFEAMLFFALWLALIFLKVPVLLRGAILFAFPLLFTGGIHMDGFLDVVDATSSHQTKERKLEILKDSHTGAFAIIGFGIYSILYFSAISIITNPSIIAVFSISFGIIRGYSALSLLCFKNARGSGLAMTFTQMSDIRGNCIGLIVEILLLTGISVCIHIGLGIMMTAVVFLTFVYYRIWSEEQFGGITGDVAGFFLQIAELFVILALSIGGI